MPEKTNRSRIRIELTPEQREQIRAATGKEVSALELQPKELEARVAPGAVMFNPKEYEIK